jgi:hypothetical protein
MVPSWRTMKLSNRAALISLIFAKVAVSLGPAIATGEALLVKLSIHSWPLPLFPQA